MKYSLLGVFIAGTLLMATPALSQSSPGAALPAVRHLVYQFGYNTKAAKQGNGTGTTTIDIVGLGADGGMKVTATDHWWNTVNPRQTSNCEVYANGGITCAQRPYILSPIQVTILSMLGQHYFSALLGGTNVSWTQTFAVKASIFPNAPGGFSGQLYTWNCTNALQAKGTTPNEGKPVVVVHGTGTMKQQGGRAINVNQTSTILFDPRLKMPVYLSEVLRFVPARNTNRYEIELKLINYSSTPSNS
ncbi:MAG TPA: hypothetical protein VGK84_12150 [Candidatus Tumulicola sp.]